MDTLLPNLLDAKPKLDFRVLTSPKNGAAIGYQVGGFNPGPSVLVAGHDPVASLVYERLLQLPTLSRMRGDLTLVYLNALEDAAMASELEALIEPKPDEVIFLPYLNDQVLHEIAADQGYWTVLRFCTSLGMISGRGIPRSPLENNNA